MKPTHAVPAVLHPALLQIIMDWGAVPVMMQLLRNHGSIAYGKDLQTASALAEELEEQARLYFLLQGRGRELSSSEVSTLHTLYGSRKTAPKVGGG